MQKLSVGSECETMGIVAHEIGHAVAFWHEHSRPDRNKYIKILKKNVKSERLHAFDRMSKSKVNSLKVPYDFLSIMHYDENVRKKTNVLTALVLTVCHCLRHFRRTPDRLSSFDMNGRARL